MKDKFNTDYLKELYESLEVSESAKSRFFEDYLKEDAPVAAQGGDKGGNVFTKAFYKFAKWMDKGTPTVESSTQKIMEALAGMEQIIQTSPLADEKRKQRDLQYIQKFKAQVTTATQGVTNAQAKYNEAKKNFEPQIAKSEQAMAAEVAQEEKVLDEIKNRIDTNAENPEELQKIKTELEQKIQEAKEVDPENGGEAEQELLDDVNKKLETSGSAEATEEKPEEKPDGESTTEEPKDGEGTDKRVEDNEAGKNGNVKDINDEEEQERLGESIEG
jgi:hypothetical protein